MLGTPIRGLTPATEDEELQRDRARNDAKLKHRFERIFDKYNKDFSSIGDEIDLLTGRVVVDNGHLTRMEHERDPGSRASRQFVRAFTQGLGTEDHQETGALHGTRLDSRAQAGRQLYRTPSVEISSDDAETPLDSTSYNEALAHSKRSHRSRPSHQTNPDSLNCPQPSRTLITTQPDKPAAAAMDPNAVQSLGQALANQIASFLNQQTTSSILPPRNDQWSFPPLPAWYASQGPVHHSPVAPSEHWRSVSPSGDLSLWADHRRNEEDDGFDRARPVRKRRKLHGSIAVDQRNTVMPSVEYDFLTDEEQDEQTDGLDDHPRTIVGHEHRADSQDILTRSESIFAQSARHNFQMLAHGIANRGYLYSDELYRPPRRAVPPPCLTTQISATMDGSMRELQADGRRKFSPEEDILLVRLKERENLRWSEIHPYFPHRSLRSVIGRYFRSLRSGPLRPRNADADRLVEILDDTDASPPPGDDGTVTRPPHASQHQIELEDGAEYDHVDQEVVQAQSPPTGSIENETTASHAAKGRSKNRQQNVAPKKRRRLGARKTKQHSTTKARSARSQSEKDAMTPAYRTVKTAQGKLALKKTKGGRPSIADLAEKRRMQEDLESMQVGAMGESDAHHPSRSATHDLIVVDTDASESDVELRLPSDGSHGSAMGHKRTRPLSQTFDDEEGLYQGQLARSPSYAPSTEAHDVRETSAPVSASQLQDTMHHDVTSATCDQQRGGRTPTRQKLQQTARIPRSPEERSFPTPLGPHRAWTSDRLKRSSLRSSPPIDESLLDPALRGYSPDHLVDPALREEVPGYMLNFPYTKDSAEPPSDPATFPTPSTSPDGAVAVEDVPSRRSSVSRSTPKKVSKQGARKLVTLRSSVLRKTFRTPKLERARASSIVSTASSRGSFKSGPVPPDDASDDDLI